MKTAFVYDPFNLRHTLEGHPENYRRLEGTWALLEQDGILDELVRVPATPAPHEALLTCHSAEYIRKVEAISAKGGGRLDPDTYANEDTYQAALLSAGGVLNVLDAVMTEAADNGFALVRPPGHHAVPERAMGFCLFSNVAIAARWAQQTYGIQRVLIVDFDVHHGNGTQDIFYDDPSILFFSIHQYPHYPGTGAAMEMGSQQAKGSTINVPAPPYSGDEGYLRAFEKILKPAARRFRPELIILSAGYDGHWQDPLAHIQLSVTGYAHQVEFVMKLAQELCKGKLVCALEGGYNLEVLPHCVLSTLRLLSGSDQGISDPFGPAPDGEQPLDDRIREIREIHAL
ncbi:MAG: histone deacetylase [Chloroflexota bacterium]